MGKLVMTNNEYQEYLKKNASRIYNEEGYTMKNYNEDADNVELLDFDLSMYNLPDDVKMAINSYFMEETTDRNDHRMFKGRSMSEGQWCRITYALKLKRVYGYYYSGYCYNNELKMYMTYCEGDLYLKIYENQEEYETRLQETIKWYEENT